MRHAAALSGWYSGWRVPILIILILFSGIALILLIPAIKGML
jgi:hypothetical protein